MSSDGVPVHPGGGDDGAPATRAHPWVDAAPGVDAWSIDRCGLDVAEDEVLGQGATGCVYRGTLGAREVAVKIMQPKQGRSAAERHQMLEDVLQVARALFMCELSLSPREASRPARNCCVPPSHRCVCVCVCVYVCVCGVLWRRRSSLESYCRRTPTCLSSLVPAPPRTARGWCGRGSMVRA